jgi:hypothetical protein
MGDVKALAMQWVTDASVPRSIRWQQEMTRGTCSQYFGTLVQFCDCRQATRLDSTLVLCSSLICHQSVISLATSFKYLIYRACHHVTSSFSHSYRAD